jgi:transposase-like protein
LGHLPKGEYDVDHGGSKARRTRRSFTDDYKAGAVRLVLDEGRTVAAAARDLGLTESALRNWVEQARADRTHGKTGLTTAEREELARPTADCLARDGARGLESRVASVVDPDA